MAVRINNSGDLSSNGVPYAEIDHTFDGKDWNVRITARQPMLNPDDSLNVIVDFHNITDAVAGRFDNVIILPKEPGDNGQRRHGLLRQFADLITNDTPIPSPVFP